MTKERQYLLLALFVSGLLLSLECLLPLNGDWHIYESMATDLLRFGKLPYLGSWDQNFPGIVYLHSIAILLFGYSVMGFHVFDVLAQIGISYFFFRLCRHWLSPQVSAIAVVLRNSYYVVLGTLGVAGQRDCYAAGLIIIGTVLLFNDRQKPRRLLSWLAIGVLFGLVPTFRPTYALYPIAAAVYSWFRYGAKPTLFLALGVVLVAVAMITPYAFYPDGIAQLYYSIIRFNLDLYGPIRVPLSTPMHWMFVSIKLFTLPALLGLGVTLYNSRSSKAGRKKDNLLLAAYLVAALASMFAMGKYMLQHYEPLMYLMMPFSAVGLWRCVTFLKIRALRSVALAGYLVFMFYAMYPAFIRKLWFEGHSVAEVAELTEHEPNFRISVEHGVLHYLAQHTCPSDTVEVVGLSAALRRQVPNPSATRFTMFFSIGMTTRDGAHPAYQEAWRQELTTAIARKVPRYLILADGPKEAVEYVSNTPLYLVHDIRGFDSVFFANYRADTVIGGYHLFERRP